MVGLKRERNVSHQNSGSLVDFYVAPASSVLLFVWRFTVPCLTHIWSLSPVYCVLHLGTDKLQKCPEPLRCRFSMYPSYPSFRRYSDLAVQFAVLERHVVKHILDCTENKENLRFRAAGNILSARVRSLASLMSRHRIQVESINSNEIGITLFLPPPPCPAPKSKLFATYKRTPFTPSLALIRDEETPQGLRKTKPRNDDRDWITMYEYLPSEKRRAFYVAPDDEKESMKRFI